jgi:hypothetical protein
MQASAQAVVTRDDVVTGENFGWRGRMVARRGHVEECESPVKARIGCRTPGHAVQNRRC